jgi:single-stranded-DNA-specific exonuclease
MIIPEPKFTQRIQNKDIYQSVIAAGKSELVAEIAASRGVHELGDLFTPSIGKVNIGHLKGLPEAVYRLIKAFVNKETVALVVDFDVDGISSSAIMWLAMVNYLGFEKSKVRVHINNRMVDSYGFNDSALDAVMNAHENPPTLIITADQGSNDNERVKSYKKQMTALGYDYAGVIVTDHHVINDMSPCADADAFINPNQIGCQFDDKTVCGAVVAFFLMAATRTEMIKRRMIPQDTKSLSDLLSYACMATVADCVSLASPINRLIVRKGIRDINTSKKPAWQVLRESIKKPGELITTKDIGFALAPRINADSRTGGDGTDALNFMLAEDYETAFYYFENLTQKNKGRQKVQKEMVIDAKIDASKQYYDEGLRGLVLQFDDGSHGIQGIVASKIKDMFNCPTICLSPKSHDDRGAIYACSGRSVDGVDVSEVIERVKSRYPELGLQSGGHHGAFGGNLPKDNIPLLRQAFNELLMEYATEKGLAEDHFYPTIALDVILKDHQLLSLEGTDILIELNKLEPYGQGFPPPIIGIPATIKVIKPFRNVTQHVNICFKTSNGRDYWTKFFDYESSPISQRIGVGSNVIFALEMSFDDYYGKLGMNVVGISA